jgi:hypothetical protein
VVKDLPVRRYPDDDVHFRRGHKDGWHGEHRHIGLHRDERSVALLAIWRDGDETWRETHRLGYVGRFANRGRAGRVGRWLRSGWGNQGHIGVRVNCRRRQGRRIKALGASVLPLPAPGGPRRRRAPMTASWPITERRGCAR